MAFNGPKSGPPINPKQAIAIMLAEKAKAGGKSSPKAPKKGNPALAGLKNAKPTQKPVPNPKNPMNPSDNDGDEGGNGSIFG